MKKKLAAIRKFSNIQKVLNRIIKDNEPEIIAMNRDQMWEDGIVDVVKNLQWFYQPSTIKQKKKYAKYKRTDHITLRNWGDLYEGMKLEIKPDQFIITSTDDKWPKFSSGAWGEGRFKNALGLTAKNKEELRNLIRSDLIIGFRDALQNS